MGSESREPGSLLIFPEVSNLSGTRTIVSVTNVNSDVYAGDVTVEYRYIGARDEQGRFLHCLEFNRLEHLTPNDTLTVSTHLHNPDDEEGYLAVFARDDSGQPIQFNYLIGQSLVLDGVRGTGYTVNAFSFKAQGFGPGLTTDLNGNFRLDMDGMEYEALADRYLIPRFFGQDRRYQGELVLLDMSGRYHAETLVDILLFNDNEEAFSATHAFRCWDSVPLTDITFAFTNQFLSLYTNHDPSERLGANEQGWFHVQGAVSNGYQGARLRPGILAFYKETTGTRTVADLPFGTGERTTEGPFRIF